MTRSGLERQDHAALSAVLAGLAAPGPPVSPPVPDRGAPRVAVSMPARDAGRWIAAAARSVLDQRGVRVELWVVDDGSEDDTASRVRALDDPRVRLLIHDRPRGIGACHNRVVAESDAPWVAHCDADDVLLPGALREAVAALEAEPAAGQAFALHVEADADLRLSPASFEEQRALLGRAHAPGRNLGRDLLVHGMVANPLRTYRRSALEAVGPFREDLRMGTDYDMALRMADRFPLVLVPRFLYGQRVHGGNVQQTLAFRAPRLWWVRARIVVSLLVRKRGRLLGRGTAGVLALLAEGALEAAGVAAPLKRAGRAVLRRPVRVG